MRPFPLALRYGQGRIPHAFEQAGRMKSAILCLWCACVCLSCRPVPSGVSRSAITNDPELNTSSADMGRSTNVIVVGDWSKPVKDADGYVLRGRLILYDMPHYTNQFPGAATTEYWGNAPLFLELQNLSPRMDKSLGVYFALGDGLECELLDSRGGHVTNSLFVFFSGSLRPWFRSYWITVPLDGSVRLRADPQTGGHSPKAGGLEIELSQSQRWIIPAGDTSAYYLSGNFSPPTNHPAPPGSHVWRGKLILPPMRITAPNP